MNKRKFLKILASLPLVGFIATKINAKETVKEQLTPKPKEKFDNCGDYIFMSAYDKQTHKLVSQVSFNAKYARKKRWDVVNKAMERLYNEIILKDISPSNVYCTCNGPDFEDINIYHEFVSVVAFNARDYNFGSVTGGISHRGMFTYDEQMFT